MARILILIILGWILYQVIKRMATSADSKPNIKSEEKPEEKIVQCANCGCHVPESESIIKNNQIICNNPECLKK